MAGDPTGRPALRRRYHRRMARLRLFASIREAAGTARTFPDPPERCEDRAIAIWC